VAVVGGGPAGLAAAYRLSRNQDINVVLLERAPSFGGLAAGMEHEGMRLDFGPHRLHQATDPEVFADLKSLLGADLLLQPRRGRIMLLGRSLPYPPGPTAALALGVSTSIRLGLGLIFQRGARAETVPTYESAVVARLGRPLYDMFYGPYAEKVWGLPGNELAAEQANRRVNQRGVRDILRLVARSGRQSHYYYPAGGFGRIPEAYVQALKSRMNVTLVSSASITAVRAVGGSVAQLTYTRGDVATTIDVDQLVWSAPVTELARLAGARSEVQQAAGRLRYRSLVLAYLQLPISHLGDADTYYFPERRFPFNRIAEQKNFGGDTVPDDRTVLVMDLACDANDERFTATDDSIRELVVAGLRASGLLQHDPSGFWTRRFRYAYPIYDLTSSASLACLHAWADSLPNVWLIGRQGLFLHNNTHHSLLMGYKATDAISQGWSRDRWKEQLEVFGQFSVED
jgi:protoporphyrinogen oxidase